MPFQLVITVQNKPKRLESLPDGDLLIGRSRSAHIHLSQPDVSGKHLILHVDGESVIVENLSTHGTRTMETAIELPTPLRDGDTLFLGEKTSLTLKKISTPANGPEQTAPAAPPIEPEEPAKPGKSGKTIPEEPVALETPPEDLDKTILEETPPPPFDPERTSPGETICPVDIESTRTILPGATETAGSPGSAESHETLLADPDTAHDDVLKTNVMQTRIASPEEIEFLRRQDRKQKRSKKLKYILGIAGLIAVLAAAYLCRGKAPEEKLTWPRDKDGTYAEKPFDPADGGFRQGRFSVIAPLVPSTKSRIETNGDLVITTRTGRDRDVPLRIVLSVKRSPAYLHETREETFQDWISEISTSGGHWNFDRMSDLFFLGENNGLPCLGAVYSREAENQSWYGEVLFFRNGDERIVRLVEIPGQERARGAGFISSTPFLFTSEEFVENHWEGSPDLYSGDPANLLNEAKALLVKMSPATWDKITMLLRTVLCAAVEKGNPKLRQEALEQLRKLRGHQRVWYNAQCLAWLKEKNAGNENGANVIRDSCLSVFSSADDLRNWNIKRNRWE